MSFSTDIKNLGGGDGNGAVKCAPSNPPALCTTRLKTCFPLMPSLDRFFLSIYELIRSMLNDLSKFFELPCA